MKTFTAYLETVFGAEYKLGCFDTREEAAVAIAAAMAAIEATGKFRKAVAFLRHFRGVIR